MSNNRNRNFYRDTRESKPVNKENIEEVVNATPVEETGSTIKKEFGLPEDKAEEVATEFMTPPEEENTESSEEEGLLFGEVICERLRVRKEPSTESDVLGILKRGDVVMLGLSEPTNGFYQIVLPSDMTPDLNYYANSEYGFCMQEFIKINK